MRFRAKENPWQESREGVLVTVGYLSFCAFVLAFYLFVGGDTYATEDDERFRSDTSLYSQYLIFGSVAVGLLLPVVTLLQLLWGTLMEGPDIALQIYYAVLVTVLAVTAGSQRARKQCSNWLAYVRWAGRNNAGNFLGGGIEPFIVQAFFWLVPCSSWQVWKTVLQIILALGGGCLTILAVVMSLGSVIEDARLNVRTVSWSYWFIGIVGWTLLFYLACGLGIPFAYQKPLMA